MTTLTDDLMAITTLFGEPLRRTCPFCHAPAHARACDELRAVLFASDPPPDTPPGQDEYPGIDYPEDEE